jgi:hypothetical protein
VILIKPLRLWRLAPYAATVSSGVQEGASGLERRNLLRRIALESFEENWLGGRDSNPDNVVQSHVSYR